MDSFRIDGRLITGAVCVLALLLTGVLWGCPHYKVWQREKNGKAQLREAQWNRQIAVQEAKAKKEASAMLAEAEIEKPKGLARAEIERSQAPAKADVERARGVAEANRIIGQSLKNNESYLHYLWVQGLHDGKNEVIYIPTENGLPVLEAGRFAK